MAVKFFDMEYNSQKGDLDIAEYGRNIQLLVEHAKKVDDREERQVFVETIVELIQQLYPQSRNIDDWHLDHREVIKLSF